MSLERPRNTKIAVTKRSVSTKTTPVGAPPVDVHVSQKIKALRCARHQSQGALAEALGVTFQQVQKYERGTNRVGASKLFEVAKALGVDVTAFFIGPPRARPGEIGAQALEQAAFASSSEGVRLIEAFRALPAHPRRMTLGMVTALAECFRGQAGGIRSTEINFS